jgi:hypothetical protein
MSTPEVNVLIKESDHCQGETSKEINLLRTDAHALVYIRENLSKIICLMQRNYMRF